MQIRVKAILEVVGAPKDHVEKTIKRLVDRLASIEGVKLHEKDIAPVEEKDELFSAFAEVDVEFNNMTLLYSFAFNFMPSSLDIIKPEELSVDAGEFNGSMNDLLATLHNMDMMLKNSNAKAKMLAKNMDVVIQNYVRMVTKEPKTIDEIASLTGIPKENIEKIVEHLEKNKRLKKDGDKYTTKA